MCMYVIVLDQQCMQRGIQLLYGGFCGFCSSCAGYVHPVRVLSSCAGSVHPVLPAEDNCMHTQLSRCLQQWGIVCGSNAQMAGTCILCSMSFQVTIKQARKHPVVHAHYNDYSFNSNNLLQMYTVIFNLTIWYKKYTSKLQKATQVCSWNKSCLIMYRLIWYCWKNYLLSHQCWTSLAWWKLLHIGKQFRCWSCKLILVCNNLHDFVWGGRLWERIYADLCNLWIHKPALMLPIHTPKITHTQPSQATLDRARLYTYKMQQCGAYCIGPDGIWSWMSNTRWQCTRAMVPYPART